MKHRTSFVAPLLILAMLSCVVEEESLGRKGGGKVDDGGVACATPSPQGCKTIGCPQGQLCYPTPPSCTPSSCSCDSQTGAWICSSDCTGGVCRTPDAGIVPRGDAARD